MAKAVANCTCKKCGAAFEKTTIKRNTTEANSWAEWAAGYYDLCPDCWKKQQHEEEQAKPLTLVVSLVPNSKKCVLTWRGGTDKYEDEIEDLGYKFTTPIYENTQWNMFSIYSPKRGWTKVVDYSELNDALDIAKEKFDPLIDNRIKQVDVLFANEYQKEMSVIEKERAEYRDEMNQKIDSLIKSVRPAFLPEGKWNGKIYRSKRLGSSVYIDNQKIELSDEQVDVLDKYVKDKESYNEEVRKIKAAYQHLIGK